MMILNFLLLKLEYNNEGWGTVSSCHTNIFLFRTLNYFFRMLISFPTIFWRYRINHLSVEITWMLPHSGRIQKLSSKIIDDKYKRWYKLNVIGCSFDYKSLKMKFKYEYSADNKILIYCNAEKEKFVFMPHIFSMFQNI